ncbi:MAG: Gfo/Idh/MocA family oxidoreductase [Chloroflexi bacterium]|nr:Gfo/Idh/MocA family oxidoreductase [Chloroflexota bacterium]
MNKLLRAAVIGAGNMGQNHARIYAEMDDVELVAIADPVLERLSRMAQRHRVHTYTDYRIMLEREQLDLISVVVPTEQHFEVTHDVLSAGVPVLVEKPIASTVEQGLELIALSKEMDVLLTVGHIERFNPAIIALKHQLSLGTLGRIYQIHAMRLGPFPARITDVGVVIDLATHDLDILHYLTNANISRVHAEVGRQLHTAHEDMLSAILRFDNGIVGVLDINWLTPTKVREISVIGEGGMFVASYLTQDLILYENDAAPQGNDWQQLSVLGVSEGRSIHFKINKREPLREELEAFASAIRMHGAPPVRGEDAVLALSFACKLIEAGANGGTLEISEPPSLTVHPTELVPSKLPQSAEPVFARSNGHG